MAVTPQGKPYAELDHIKNANKQYLFRKVWQPDGDIRGLVEIVHGYAEHISGYGVIAEPLVKEGFLVFGHDHVGHGQSQGDRVHIDDFSIYVRDVLHHTDIMTKKYPKLPVFLVGHSMGGLIAAMAAQVRVELYQGVVLIAPAFLVNPKTASKCKQFLATMVASIAPQLVLGKLDPDGMSRDPKVVEEYLADPLNALDGIKARFGVELMNAQKSFVLNVHRFEVPFLTMHGTSDDIVDAECSQMFYEKARSRDKSIKLYPGWYHQLHSEPDGDGERAVTDVVNWLTDRLKLRLDI